MGSSRRGDASADPPPVTARELTRKQGAYWLAGITLVGAFLRILTLNSRSFWLDEATTVRQASWSLPMIFERMSANVHPPLFHILMHYWIRIFGRAELSVRGYPLLFGLLAIPLAYWVGSTIYDRRVGVISAAIVAIAPHFIWYSQEARMYSLLFVLALASTGTLARALQTDSRPWWVAYALSTAAGMFTQYFFAFLILMQGFYMLVFYTIAPWRELKTRGELRASWTRPQLLFADFPAASKWLLCLLVVFAPQAWWIPKVLSHPEITGGVYQSLNYGNSAPALGWHFNEIILAAGQAVFGMHSEAASRVISAMWPLVITIAFIISSRMRRFSRRTWLLVYSGVFSTLLIAIIGQWQPVYEVRYYTAVMAPLVILIARFFAELRLPVSRLTAIALVGAALLCYVDQSYNADSIVKWDNREATGIVHTNYQPGDVVLLVPYYASSIMEYYLPPDEYFAIRKVPVFTTAGVARNSREELDSDLRRQVGAAKRIWLVSTFVETPRIEKDREIVVDWLEQNGYTRTSDAKLHRIRVCLYQGIPHNEFFINQGGGQ